MVADPLVAARDAPTAADPRFRRMLGAKLCVDIAENALAYALLIAIVRRTGSGVHSTLLVLAFTLPAIVFGIPAGEIADRLPKRGILIAALVVRAALALSLLHFITDVWRAYLIILVFAAVGQVFGPVWTALLPAFVGYGRLSRANSLLSLTQIGGQVAGVVVIAPLLLKTLGERAVFVVAVIFFLGALVMTLRIGAIPEPRIVLERPEGAAREVRAGLLAGWRVIRADDRMFAAATQLSIVACVLKGLIVLLPFYTRQVLHIAPDNTVFVAAPAALGRLGHSRIATAGFFLLVLSLGALALVEPLRPLVVRLHLGMSGVAYLFGIRPIVTTAMLFAVPLGFGTTLAMIAARTVLNEQAPAAIQARVFATQNAIANVDALLPLFAMGVLTSLIGARPVMLLTALVAGATAILLGWWHGGQRGNAGDTFPR